jgi:hypothetical protein
MSAPLRGAFVAGRQWRPMIQMLNFTLTYDGPLASGGSSKPSAKKQAIRRAFHPQLRIWWETGPLAAALAEIDKTGWQVFKFNPMTVDPGFTFIPVLYPELNCACELDILMLKPENPGHFIKNNGDIDNRLKILFDALRMPTDKSEIPHNDTPSPDESPYFFCLLQDDSLITKVTIRADRLLQSLKSPLTPDHIRLMIGVTIRATHLTHTNFAIGT